MILNFFNRSGNINYAKENDIQPGSIKKMFSLFTLTKEGKV